jgi:hypothetical protein
MTPLPHPKTPRCCQLGLYSRSHPYRVRTARISVSRAKPTPPRASRVLGPPGLPMTPLPHLQPHATVSWGCTSGPTDTEPMRLGFRFWRQTAPISRLPGSSPPGLFTYLSPAAHQPPTLLGGAITKVTPTSSPCGSIFGFGAKPPPSRAYRAPALPLL